MAEYFFGYKIQKKIRFDLSKNILHIEWTFNNLKCKFLRSPREASVLFF